MYGRPNKAEDVLTHGIQVRGEETTSNGAKFWPGQSINLPVTSMNMQSGFLVPWNGWPPLRQNGSGSLHF